MDSRTGGPPRTASPEVVICGAGIAGIAAAYHLTVRHGLRDVVVVDERPPMTLTSDKSSEGYRNWWPGPDAAMIQLMNRSIDLMEGMADECGNCFRLNRRGYLYATADPQRLVEFRTSAEETTRQGAGSLRIHEGRPGEPAYEPAPPEGYADQPDGADLILDQSLIRRYFPFLAEDTLAVLHARRCGWFSGQQFGMMMLERALAAGARLVSGKVESVQMAGGRVQSVSVRGVAGTENYSTSRFVNAAGPFIGDVAALLDVALPVFCEAHLKLSFTDTLGVIPRHAPMTIWADPQHLPWSSEEREMLAEDPESHWLLASFPPAVHFRPEGGDDSPMVLMLWPYHVERMSPTFPISIDPVYHEIVLRGLARAVPGLRRYLEHIPKPIVDGGYYTKTAENRPLICPLPVEGAYLIGALSGFGLMSAAASGELLAAHVTGSSLPDYAPAFDLARYDDPAYVQRMAAWEDGSQL